MKNHMKLFAVAAMAFTMAATTDMAIAQTRRTGSTSTSATQSGSSQSTSGSTSTTRRTSGTAATTGSTAAKQTAATPSATRQNQTPARQTSSATSGTSSTTRRTGTTASQSTSSTAKQTANQTPARQAGTTTSGTTSTTRRSSSTVSSSSSSKGSTSTARRTTTATGNPVSASSVQNAAQTERANASAVTQTQPVSRATTTSRSNTNVTASKGLANFEKSETKASSNVMGSNRNMKLNNHDVIRIAPRERERIQHSAPAHFYEPGVHHYFGYCIHSLPPKPVKHVHWGVTYYCYNNVYYRPWGDRYYVCRPPFGVCIEREIAKAQLAAIRFAFYPSVYRTYNILDDNYRIIDRQNRIIANNNAIIAAQNANMALNSSRALSSYEIASRLGLVQSYANAYLDYYYEDGVFYTINRKNQYEVIVPPAGALVQELPDDYDTIVMDGQEYYKVDNTVYRVTLVDGTPLLEVLGQLTGSLAAQYYYYR